MGIFELNATPARPIRFFHRRKIVEVRDEPPTRTVLDWLRNSAERRGTKEGCAEGDCGACTVLIAELTGVNDVDPRDRSCGVKIKAVNACIKFLPTLDGCALLTVEDLRELAVAASGKPGQLHPVQQALVEHHGSQCGFCTPGFVMSLAATYERHLDAGTRPTRGQLADDVAGNLCRCTGYRPIIDAGQAMFDLPALKIDLGEIAAALLTLQDSKTFRYVAAGAEYWAPKTLSELATVRTGKAKARIFNGATDVGLWVTKQLKDIGDLIFAGAVKELQTVEERDGLLLIGAGVPLENAWAEIVARWPELRDIWLRFASPPIRFAGTLGGNVANGSPIGDGPPVLIALGSSVVLRKGEQTRELRLEDFYLDYMKNALDEGEFVQQLRLPLRQPSQTVRAYKVSKRFDSDISAVLAAIRLTFADDGTISDARFAFGGVAAVPKRAAGAEAAVLDQDWDEATLAAAQDAIGRDFSPLTDQRGSADYRKSLLQGLLKRFWLETRGGSYVPLQPAETSVFAVLQH